MRRILSPIALVASCRPRPRPPPPPSLRRPYATGDELDVVVIGGGPGGYVAAIKAGQLGMRAACVESRGTLGGTCLNVGCIPSKALLHTSHLYDLTKAYMPAHGIELPTPPRMNVAKMQAAKASAVSKLTGGIEHLFKKNKVAWEKGRGTLAGPGRVAVTRPDGSVTELRTKHIVLATGSAPASLPGVVIDEERVVTSTGALALPEVPRRLLLIGGGVIGLELGSVWQRLGAEVTCIEYMPAIGAGADGEVAKQFQRFLTKQGIKFQLETKVLSVTREGAVCKVVTEPVKGGPSQTQEADVVLVAVGRTPYTEGLGLERLGVRTDKKGFILVDDHRRTNVPNVWAIGDVIPGPMLAHKAEEEGIAVIEEIASPGSGHVNYGVIPSVIYTQPEVAWVGRTEEQLRAQGTSYRTGKFPFAANSRAKTNDETEGFVKVLAEEGTDRVLGVHIVGPSAGELIAEAALALEYGASSEDIARTCHAHPTLSEAVKEAAMAAHGSPIHA